MKKGVKSIKQEREGSSIYLDIDTWFEGTTESEKNNGNVVWRCYSQDKKNLLKESVTKAKDTFVIKIPPKLAGSYKYYIEASLIENKKSNISPASIYVSGYATKKIVASKWCTKAGGEDVRKEHFFSYGDPIFLELETEGLNGDRLIIEFYRNIKGGKGSSDDQLFYTYNNANVVDGKISVEINNTYEWFKKNEESQWLKTFKNYFKKIDKFYIKVKTLEGKYITDGKDAIHARFLRIQNKISSTSVGKLNNTSTKVGTPEINIERYEPCRYEKIIIKDKDSNNNIFEVVVYDSLKRKNVQKYETLANSDGTKKIEIDFEKITNKGCFSKSHKKELEIHTNGSKKIVPLEGNKYLLPIQSDINKYLLRSNPESFFFTPDKVKSYRLLLNTCAQPNNPFYINVFPNIERELSFVLGLFPSFNAEVNRDFSNRKRLVDYNQNMQLIQKETEILYNVKGGLGYGFQAKVKVDEIISSIELGRTRSQIKRLFSFYYRIKENIEPFNGKGKESNSLAYRERILPKVIFDLDPPDIVLALRLTNKKIENTQKIVRQYAGVIALRPITRIKIAVDLLSLLEYMGVGGKIASWIKEKLEKKYKFSIYIIFELSLEVRGEFSLDYNEIEGFSSGNTKLQVEAVLGIKGGIKSTEEVVVFVPEADGKLQKVKVNKWKAEAATSAVSLLYTFEINSDAKGPYMKHKMEFSGVKATIIIYRIKEGIKYNENFKRVFTIIEKPKDPWYKSDKEYIL